jgi:hypothetical protein
MTRKTSDTKSKTSENDKEIQEPKEPLVKKRGPGRPPKNPVKKEHYVDGKQFMAEIITFYDTDCTGEDITDELATMIYSIANRLAYAPNFINYTYREEMVGDAVIKMFNALIAKKFDPTKGYAPFSYFTKISFNAFRNRIKKEKKAREAIQKYQEEVYEVMTNHDYINDTSHHHDNEDRDF